MACPTQLLNGRCWTLGALGQSCADACGGGGNVDVEALDGASSSATIDHLEALYGCHTTSRDGADRWCGPPAEAMFAFIPLVFSNFGGEGERAQSLCLQGRLARCLCTTTAAVDAAPVGGDAARAVLPAIAATAAIAAGLGMGVVERRSRRCLGPSIRACAALGNGALTCPRHQRRCPLRAQSALLTPGRQLSSSSSSSPTTTTAAITTTASTIATTGAAWRRS